MNKHYLSSVQFVYQARFAVACC